MGSCGSSCGCGSGGQRAFLTKEEKIQALQEYKAELEKEVKGINEQIKELNRKD